MSIILKPRVSEKSYAQSANRVFIFDVDTDLNKHQIAEAVAKTYEVTVTGVRIVVQKGKEKRYYRNRRYENGVRSDIKKAYVTLKEGQSIPIFASVEQEEVAEEADKKAKKAKKKEEK
jgi:large subunit ribosomal protein L23